MGTLLVSDLITHWLVSEKEALDALPADKRQALKYELPKDVLNDAAHRLTHERCYGLNMAGIITEMAATANKSDAQAQEVGAVWTWARCTTVCSGAAHGAAKDLTCSAKRNQVWYNNTSA